MKNKINFTSKTAMVVTIVGIGAWAFITLIICLWLNVYIHSVLYDTSNTLSYSNVEYDNVFEWKTMPNENPDLLTPIDRNVDYYINEEYFNDDSYIDPITYMRNYWEIPVDAYLFRGRVEIERTGITMPTIDGGGIALGTVTFPDGRYIYVLINHGDMLLYSQDVIDVYGYYLAVVNESDIGFSGNENIIVIMPDFIYYVN